MRRDIKLTGQNLPVSGSLIQHDNKIGVLKDVFDLSGGQEVLNILRDTGRNAAPFTESFPDLNTVGCGLFLLQKQVELIHIVAGCFTGVTVGSNTAPDLILNHQHADFLQLLA